MAINNSKSNRYNRRKRITSTGGSIQQNRRIGRGAPGSGRITQFQTPILLQPSPQQISKLKLKVHHWAIGDKYWKLAQEHYGNPGYWWVIAAFNRKPTEAHVHIGCPIIVPHPLDKILEYMGV